jgi:hypothetical protein
MGNWVIETLSLQPTVKLLNFLIQFWNFLFSAGFRYAYGSHDLDGCKTVRPRPRPEAPPCDHRCNYCCSPERKAASNFFAALQSQNYEAAYAVWFRDPDWKQHTSKYSAYQFNDFYRDWGPGGEWGLIKSYSVDCSLSPAAGSGVIVQVTVNSRAEHAYVWVEKSNKTLSFSPNEIECGNWWTWVTE